MDKSKNFICNLPTIGYLIVGINYRKEIAYEKQCLRSLFR